MKDRKDNHKDQMPPLFKSWRSIYLLVIANLAFLITLFYLLTSHYS